MSGNAQHVRVNTENVDSAEREYVLVSPGQYFPRDGKWFNRICTYEDVPHVLRAASSSRVVAVDLETRGSDYSSDLDIVGIGLSWDSGSCYLPFSTLYTSTKQKIVDFLYTHPALIAHNVYFDGGVLYSKFKQHPSWLACTYAAYYQVANEGWAGQSHGLKSAMTEVLGWKDSNETELDQWLVTNGYYKGNRRKDESREALLASHAEGTLKPEKAEMWRAPVEILGKYCILDAEATYLLFTEILNPILEQFPELFRYHNEYFLHLIRVHIEQKILGIEMDVPAIQSRHAELLSDIARLEKSFRFNPTVRPHLERMEQEMLAELAEKEPERHKKQKERKEPNQYRKDGSISKNWMKWMELRAKAPEVSKNWINWSERWGKAVRGENPDYRFNMNSDIQMRTLLYERLGFEPKLFAESGLASTSIKAFRGMGEVGAALVDHSYAVKEMGFIRDYMERTEHRTTIHPDFRLPGTCTGRLSSKQPNFQQVPKTKAMMSLFRARPGHVWVDLDFSALEAMVATEFSRDPNMMLLYGPDATPNDIHLFVASSVPGLKEKVLGAGYTAINPTREGLSRAKKEAKRERSIAKTVVYACQYGAGVDKVWSQLEADGVDIEREQVEKVHSTYWKLFNGVKQFSYQLTQEWRRNRGYVMNGLGRPMCVPDDYRKDILNRFIQSTGHDILVKYIYILTCSLTGAGIPWQPLIIDLHDAATVEVPEQYADATVAVFESSMRILNEELGWSIQLKGVPTVGTSMDQIKEPEE